MGPVDRPHVTKRGHPPALWPGLPLSLHQEPRTTFSRYTEGHRDADELKTCPALLLALDSAARKVSYFLQRLSVKGSAFRARAELTPLHVCQDQQGLGAHKVPLYLNLIWPHLVPR